MLYSKYDAKLDFGESSAFGSAGTVASGNSIKLDKAQAGRMRVEIEISAAAVGGTNATFSVDGRNADTDSWTSVATAPVITTANMTLGKRLSIGIPPDFNYKQIRVSAVTTGTHTAGKFKAWLDVYQGA